MLIAQILYSGLGGHAAVARELATQFAAAGHENALLFYGVEPLWESSRSWCEAQNWRYACVVKRPGADLPSWLRLYRQLVQWSPRVVLCHGPASLPAVAFYTWCRKQPWFLRDTQYHQGKTWQEKFLTLLGLGLARGTIFLTAEAASHWGCFRARHRVIPNGLNLSLYQTRPPGPVRTLGTLGRLVPGKEVDVLLEAFRLLLEKGQGLRLRVAGDGPCLGPLKAWTVARGLADQVEFLGALSSEQVPDYLLSLDLYCHTTRGESLSTSLMQAMASGLPIVATYAPGVSNMLTSGMEALLVPRSDPHQLAVAIMELIEKPGLRQSLAQAARQQAVHRYCSRKQARQYLNLFQC